jgi:hypothetical protein
MTALAVGGILLEKSIFGRSDLNVCLSRVGRSHIDKNRGADVQQANEAPRWRPNPDGALMIESRFPSKTITELIAMGQDARVVNAYSQMMGSLKIIVIDQENGVLDVGGPHAGRRMPFETSRKIS